MLPQEMIWRSVSYLKVFGLTKTPEEAQQEMQDAMDEYLSTKAE